MRKFWTYLFASSAISMTFLCMNAAVWATETNQQEELSQVTSVSQLSDVQATDWAFQSLQSLVERYGCIAGYPNGTFRGNRSLTRYEFAAGVNACLDRINELIATATADMVTKEDLIQLQKLQEDFATELATLRGRVDVVEGKTTELEANQFSTTTKLQGQIVAVVSDVISGEKVGTSTFAGVTPTFGARARIELVSSFTGQDTLFTRIQANNIISPDLITKEGGSSFAGSSGDTNAIIDALWYGFPLGKKTQVKLIANAGAGDDVTNTVNIFDGDGGFGALSAFGTRNPIYAQMNGAGLAVNHQFSDRLGLSLGYLTPSGNSPTAGNGLFEGAYGALAQLTVKPSDRITVGLTYINSYKSPLTTGSTGATLQPLDVDGMNGIEVAYSSNSYGVQASVGISKNFVIGGWAGYTNSQVLTGPNTGDVDIWNYAVTLGFPDLGKKGNLAGLIVGVEPRVTSSTVGVIDKDKDTSYHIEGFYQYKISDNISITPGVIWLTAPNHDNDSDNVVIGAVRTTLSF
ncbi:iron uptake porin [Cronbergia sp. UHCC 0137]|uniref:iron uptake porin n=1 Tax=Cronbergia sp. UHCC 0137 TaxID=3110239 RepID=UPI002B1F3F77|nr:iron uptake porin [Cronbergia sp. UHCC 0137]MEA5621096.1 iron uptake porin [Cronbergia sp. UHCC 0137]